MSWSSVFAGTFVFLAIEVTFGMLASAIFGPAHASRGLDAGPGIWMIILSIVALYFGARTAAHLSGEASKLNGMYYGLVTFGRAIFSSILIATIVAGSTANASRTLLDVSAANAVWLFVTLILGGIVAGIGGAEGVPERTRPAAVEERFSVRPAA
jgi:hypothetical protein